MNELLVADLKHWIIQVFAAAGNKGYMEVQRDRIFQKRIMLDIHWYIAL